MERRNSWPRPAAGITIGSDGRRFIDKRYRGIRIGMRIGPITQEQAEQRLQTEIQHVDVDLVRRAHPRPLFRDCAARYLAQSHDKRSLEAIPVHVGLLMRHLRSLEPQQIHDATLAPFIAERQAAGVTATTINRSLEVVRTILNRGGLPRSSTSQNRGAPNYQGSRYRLPRERFSPSAICGPSSSAQTHRNRTFTINGARGGRSRE